MLVFINDIFCSCSILSNARQGTNVCTTHNCKHNTVIIFDEMVSFPGLKKDLCGALKKAIGMECRGRHITAVPQCIFYAIEKNFRKYQCVPSVPYNLLHWVPLNSSLLINTNKTYISYQSYVFISFSLSYYKVIISHTLNKCDYSMQLRKNEFRKYQCVPSVPYNLLHWIPLNSSLLLVNTNKTYISYQSYVFISFSLS